MVFAITRIGGTKNPSHLFNRIRGTIQLLTERLIYEVTYTFYGQVRNLGNYFWGIISTNKKFSCNFLFAALFNFFGKLSFSKCYVHNLILKCRISLWNFVLYLLANL